MANPPLEGDSSAANTPGVKGTNTAAGGSGVYGVNNTAVVVAGKVVGGPGVYGVSEMDNGVHGESNNPLSAGVAGINNGSGFIFGTRRGGVYGFGKQSAGVYGESGGSEGGVVGMNNSGGAGVFGSASQFDGVHGESTSNQHAGVSGTNNSGGPAVWGSASQGDGVHGECQSNGHSGVSGINTSSGASGGWGVYGFSSGYDGIRGESGSSVHAGVSANNLAGGQGLWANSPNGVAIYAQGKTAGHFQGDVQVTGDVILVNQLGADCSEDFDIEDNPDAESPGTVLVIGDDGKLAVSTEAYDSRVAGVISGAGDYRPAIVLQRIDSAERRAPIALIGKAFCKVDANSSPIRPGDLLTTSPTPGHAMKVSDKSRALGAILGKALACFDDGRGMIPIMVSLR